MKISKKLSIFITVFVLVFGTQFIQPKYTHALGPDLDDGFNIASTGTKFWQVIKETALIPAVTLISNNLIDKISNDVLSWANGGFDGEPGFINNWDYFLKDTAHAAINISLQTAMLAADKEQQGLNQATQEEAACTTALQAMYPGGPPEPVNCEAERTEDENAYAQCIEFEEFGDDPSCDDTYNPDFYYELCVEINANDLAEYNNMQQGCNIGPSYGNLAQQNYQLWQSGEVANPRNVAKTIATYGANQLNIDPVNALIGGEGNTLKRLLGTQQEINKFSNDITVGGWTGYIALADPHNYPSGLQSLVTNAVGKKTTETVSTAVQDKQTPEKFLDKVTCAEYKKGPDGERLKDASGNPICARKISGTPGAIVSDKLKGALKSGEDRATSYSNTLVGSLVNALGSITEGLVNSGLKSISSEVGNSLFSGGGNSSSSDSFAAAGVSGNYQSEYDVLGIQNDVTLEDDYGTEVVGIDGLFDSSGSSVFVGGPEDQNGTWNGGAQIIVDFKKDLEKNISYAEEEEGYYTEAKNSINTYKNTAINLDRCLPGPDYEWETRYKDRFSISGSEEKHTLNKLGLLETKEMFNDPLVNIPGSTKIKEAFASLLGTTQEEAIKIKIRKESLSRTVRTLNSIKDDIVAQFNGLVLNKPELANIVLFTDDWNSLSTEQKIQAIESSNVGFTKIDGSESDPYIQIKTDEGETAESILANNPTRAKNAVFSMAWDIWRDGAPSEEKKNLRYSYYVLENDLSNEQFIARAEANLYRVNKGGEESRKLLNDCLVLKSYALGATINQLSSAVGGPNQTSITDLLVNVNPFLGVIRSFGSGFGSLFSSSGANFSFIPLENARSDEEIKIFLEEQHQLFLNDPDSSLFQTNDLISDSAIKYSILGFDDSVTETVSVQSSPGTDEDIPDYDEVELSETEAYFQTNYPDYGFKSEIKNAYEIKDIYKYDRFFSRYLRVRGTTGTLFCRNPRTYEEVTGIFDSEDRSRCIKSWYISTNLDYETVFAGI